MQLTVNELIRFRDSRDDRVALVGEMAQRSYEESSALFYGESPLFEECLTIVHANSDLL